MHINLHLDLTDLPESGDVISHYLGQKQFELSNHLGNVLTVVSDYAIPQPSGGSVEYYSAQIISSTDYYPFGMVMPGRNSTNQYRYGYQGQEVDQEITGSRSHLAFEYRIHDARIGRFLSVDPLEPEYPWNSTYAFAENRVIDGIDLEGLEHLSVHDSGINPEDHKIENGKYSFCLGDESFENVEMQTINGMDFFDLGEHMFYGENGWSKDGSTNTQETVEIWYYLLDQNIPNEKGHAAVWNPILNYVYENHYQTNDKTIVQALFNNIDLNSNTKKAEIKSYDFSDPSVREFFMNWREGREDITLFPVIVTNQDVANSYFNRPGDNFKYNLLCNNCKHHAVRGLRKGGSDLRLGGPVPRRFLASEPVHHWLLDSPETWGTKPSYKR